MFMTKHIENLVWDTEFFSVPIGRIKIPILDDETVAVVLDDARKDGLRCLYFEADPNERSTVLTAEKNGFQLVDIRVVLEHSFGDPPIQPTKNPFPSKLIITEAVESDMPRLEEIAMSIGKFSRYAFDDNFGMDGSERLYKVWIRKSLHGLADVVFVARWEWEDGDVVGFITCLKQGGVGFIDLVGVHNANHRMRIGTGLVQSALAWAVNQNIGSMQVVTQGRNIPAQRLYQRMGFITKSITLFYHKWL